jgi:DNA-directed RNA polymerase specialized sigma24 family protein
MNERRKSTSDQIAGPAERDILLAILALLIDERAERRPSAQKIELLLDRVGLPVNTIAQVLNKQPAAVRKALTRARTSSKRDETGS